MSNDRWRDDDDDQRSWSSERNRYSGQMGGREGGYDRERMTDRMSQYGGRERSDRDYGSPERHGRGGQSGYGGGGSGQEYGSSQNQDQARGGYGGSTYGEGYGNSGYSGGGYNERGRGGFGSGGYGAERGSSASDYGGYGRGSSRGSSSYGDRGNDNDRGFMNKASDEVSSWFGDESAERRREQDKRSGHYGRGPRGYTRSDDRIREDVNDKLTDDWRVDASEIDVAVSNGEVTLTGTVNTRDEKRRAEDLAESISGVKHVQNSIRVQREQSSSYSGMDSSSSGSGIMSGSSGSSGTSGSSFTGSSMSGSRKESKQS